MKRNLSIIAFILPFLMVSCLDLSPISEIGEENFFKNDIEVAAGVTACYNGLQKAYENEWMLTDLRTDVSRVRSKTSQTSISKDLMAFDESKTSASLIEIGEYWNATYNNIYRCNKVLESIDNVANEEKRQQYTGEALFIRSYHYFNLVRLFGPVIKVDRVISALEARKMERSSVEQIYSMIIDDLNQIIDQELLPKEYGTEDLGRVTLWSAKTLLAKVYLTLQNYEEAEKLLLSVATESDRGLVLSSYADVFSINNEMNKEIIFAIRYKSGNIGTGNPFGNMFAPLNSGTAVIVGNGEGYNYPTTTLVNSYFEGDERKAATIAENYKNENGTDIQDYYVTKYLSPVVTVYDGDKDIPVLRYADVLLMLAEIENKLNGPAAGIGYLNQVRTRAKVAPYSISDLPNEIAFQMALEKERLVEFAYENHRFFDLVRTNRYIEVMNEHYKTELEQFDTELYYEDDNGLFVNELQEWQLLLPIPTAERDINPNLTQNPGY